MKECDVCSVATPKRPWPQRAYVPLYPIPFPSWEYILRDGFEFDRNGTIVGKLGHRKPLKGWSGYSEPIVCIEARSHATADREVSTR
jgi:hypothetical protein